MIHDTMQSDEEDEKEIFQPQNLDFEDNQIEPSDNISQIEE